MIRTKKKYETGTNGIAYNLLERGGDMEPVKELKIENTVIRIFNDAIPDTEEEKEKRLEDIRKFIVFNRLHKKGTA